MKQRLPALLVMVSGLVFLAASAYGFWFNRELSFEPNAWTDGKATSWSHDPDRRLGMFAIGGALAVTGAGLVLIGAWHAAKPSGDPPPPPAS